MFEHVMAWLVAYVNVCSKSMANVYVLVCLKYVVLCLYFVQYLELCVVSLRCMCVCVRLFGAHLWGHECANGLYCDVCMCAHVMCSEWC